MRISKLHTKPVRFKEVATAFSVLVLSVAVALAGELLLRFDWWNRAGVGIPASRDQNDTGAQLNFRSLGVEVVKPQHVVRIAFLGSSTTRDLYSANIETSWPHIAWKTLQSSLPDCKFEYVNAGQNGFGISAIERLYETRISELDPDVVVIAANDLARDLQFLVAEAGLTHRPTQEQSFFSRHSLLWYRIESVSWKIRRFHGGELAQTRLHYPPTDDFVKPYAERLGHFVDSVRADGRIPVLMVIPRMVREDQDKEARAITARRLLLDNPFIDLDKFFEYEKVYQNVIVSEAMASGAVLVDARDAIPGDEVNYVDSYHLAPPGSEKLGRLTGSELAKAKSILNRIRDTYPECIQQHLTRLSDGEQ